MFKLIMAIATTLALSAIVLVYVPVGLEDNFSILQSVAIVAIGVLALCLAHRRFEINDEKELNERFVKSIELLGSEKESIRIGALYALKQIGSEDGFLKESKEIIASFVRNECNSLHVKDHKKDWLKSHKPHRDLFEDVNTALKLLGEMPTCDLTNLQGVDLEGVDFTGSDINFEKFDFSGANLQNVAFKNKIDLSTCCFHLADLSGIDLSEATLKGVDLSSAYLSDVDLSGADLSGANLSGAVLETTNLYRANLSYSDLKMATLKNANLPESNLEKADLSHAQLQGASLKKANLSGANLSGANLQETYLKKTNLTCAVLENAEIQEAIFEKTICSKVDFENYLTGENRSYKEISKDCGEVN